jgi:hypothetical protein
MKILADSQNIWRLMKILASHENIGGLQNIGIFQNIGGLQNVGVFQILADTQLLADLQIVGVWQKYRRMIESWRTLKSPRLVKYQRKRLAARLLIGLGGISNC